MDKEEYRKRKFNKFKNYEYNLKLYNESIRKDLDIVLTSMVPIQKNLMKTLLWLNSSIIALIITIVLKNKDIYIIYIVIPFILSFLSILIILFSLKIGREKQLGTPPISVIEDIYQDKLEHINGLIKMSESFNNALNTNLNIIKLRGDKLSLSTNLTICSFISIVILFIIWYIYPNLNAILQF